MSRCGQNLPQIIFGSLLVGSTACGPNFTRESGSLEVQILGLSEPLAHIEILVERHGAEDNCLHFLENPTQTSSSEKYTMLVQDVPAGWLSVHTTPITTVTERVLEAKTENVYISANRSTTLTLDWSDSTDPTNQQQTLPTHTLTTIDIPIIIQTMECDDSTAHIDVLSTCVGSHIPIRKETVDAWRGAYDDLGRRPDGVALTKLVITPAAVKDDSKEVVSPNLSGIWKNLVTAMITDGETVLTLGTNRFILGADSINFQLTKVPVRQAIELFANGSEVFIQLAGASTSSTAVYFPARIRMTYKFYLDKI